MDVQQAIKKRRSVRAYQDRPVEEEKLRKVLDAARMAPSAHNAQAWKFVVVKDEERREELAGAALNQQFVAQAPVVIAGVALEPERLMSSGVPAYAVDLAIALDHITLAAVEQGLGTCWIGAFNQKEVRKLLDVPEDCKIVALMTLGYPADKTSFKSRKELDEVVSYGSFQR